MASSGKYPGPILARLSAMMELMRIAEQIEAQERARSFAARRRDDAIEALGAENVVPFRRRSSEPNRSL